MIVSKKPETICDFIRLKKCSKVVPRESSRGRLGGRPAGRAGRISFLSWAGRRGRPDFFSFLGRPAGPAGFSFSSCARRGVKQRVRARTRYLYMGTIGLVVRNLSVTCCRAGFFAKSTLVTYSDFGISQTYYGHIESLSPQFS